MPTVLVSFHSSLPHARPFDKDDKIAFRGIYNSIASSMLAPD